MRRRVLLVGGDESALEAWRLVLRPRFAVTCARDGHEALCAGPAGFDVIVTSLQMPIMDGESLKDELDALRIRVPVIFVSATADLPARSRRRRAAGFVSNPDDALELERAVGLVLQRTANREEITAVGPQPMRR